MPHIRQKGLQADAFAQTQLHTHTHTHTPGSLAKQDEHYVQTEEQMELRVSSCSHYGHYYSTFAAVCNYPLHFPVNRILMLNSFSFASVDIMQPRNEAKKSGRVFRVAGREEKKRL